MEQGKTVLLADDDWDCRHVLAEALRHVGYNVVEACDGLEALDLVQQHRPHAVVMDLMMPLLDGLVATIILRQDPELGDVPVIAVSGDDPPREAAHLFSICLRKPVSPFHLATVVTKILEKPPLLDA